MVDCGRCFDTGIVRHSETVLCYCKAGRTRRAEGEWMETLFVTVNDAYSKMDEGEITWQDAVALMRQAIALEPTKA